MRSKKPENARAEANWSRNVKERDGYVCRLEVWSATRKRYEPCLCKGSPVNPIEAAHIYPRRECPPRVKFLEVVGVAACQNHHRQLDQHDDTVRVPLDREHAAYKLICVASKVVPPRRLPPSRPVKKTA